MDCTTRVDLVDCMGYDNSSMTIFTINNHNAPIIHCLTLQYILLHFYYTFAAFYHILL